MGDFREGSVPAALAAATDVDAVARTLVRSLLDLPGVRRVGVALVEGGGRRLRFLPATREETAAVWCHIDAYDDVPLTRVVRTGEPVLGRLDQLESRYAALVDAQRRHGTVALAAVPLPGAAGPLGGLIVYYDVPQDFAAAQRHALSTVARHAADAVRRVRARPGRGAGAAGVAAVPARTAGCTLPDDPRAPRESRLFLGATLRAWGVDDEVVDTAELCVSELVTNAVIHAAASSDLTITLEEGLLSVRVRDHGGPSEAAPEVLLDDDPLRVFGRGLALVEALSDKWGTDHDDVGTTSWFVIEVHDARVAR